MKKQKIAAVICEYDPFHIGHAYLYQQLRNAVGNDTVIVAIMSGNFTQRGEAAFFPKQVRAACAIRGGADLILELPVPYSCAGAERFARAGVHIADALQAVDFLFFGSECGNIKKLQELAIRLESQGFQEAYHATSEHSPLGCAQKTEYVYTKLYGENDPLLPLLKEPNNVLGIEYLRALLRSGSKITPLTFTRKGMQHHAFSLQANQPITSAGAARKALASKKEREIALSLLPNTTFKILENAMQSGNFLSQDEPLLQYALLFYRQCNRAALLSCDGMAHGLGDRILHAAQNNATAADFFTALRSKKCTDAYLRRALLYGIFNISREVLNTLPAYTQILGMSQAGQALLSSIRKTATIPLLNRPSAAHKLSSPANEIAQISFRADSLYCGFLVSPSCPGDLFRYNPYRESP